MLDRLLVLNRGARAWQRGAGGSPQGRQPWVAAWLFHWGHVRHGACTRGRRLRPNGCAVPLRAIRALICAYEGVLPSRAGVLWELRYRGLCMTPMDHQCPPESSIPDICGRNHRQHALASLRVGLCHSGTHMCMGGGAACMCGCFVGVKVQGPLDDPHE